MTDPFGQQSRWTGDRNRTDSDPEGRARFNGPRPRHGQAGDARLAPAQLFGGKMTSAWTPAGVLDSAGPIPGYFDSPWPAECGGPRRQRIPRSAGLGVGKATGLRQRSRTNGEWNVLVVLRAPGEMYLQYTNHLANPEKYGQVELIDAVSLEAVRRSPRLPTGGHTWCTALVAHENGYLYLTSGNRCVKLDPDCAVVAEAVLPRDSAYNGLIVAADGRLIMKNIERDAGQLTTLTVLDRSQRGDLRDPAVRP